MTNIRIALFTLLVSTCLQAQVATPTAKDLLDKINCLDTICFDQFARSKSFYYNPNWFSGINECTQYYYSTDTLSCQIQGANHYFEKRNYLYLVTCPENDSIGIGFATQCKDIYTKTLADFVADGFTMQDSIIDSTQYGHREIFIYKNPKRPMLELAIQHNERLIPFIFMLGKAVTTHVPWLEAQKPLDTKLIIESLLCGDTSCCQKYTTPLDFEVPYFMPIDTVIISLQEATKPGCPPQLGNTFKNLISYSANSKGKLKDWVWASGCTISYTDILESFKKEGFVKHPVSEDESDVYLSDKYPTLKLHAKIAIDKGKPFAYSEYKQITTTTTYVIRLEKTGN